MSDTTHNDARPLAAVILAAGKGTRMQSDRAKCAHEVGGRAMVAWVVDAVRAAGAERIVLVVGFGADEIRTLFADADDVEFVVQEEQLGTGHATRCAEPLLRDFAGDVLVLAGDGPLIRAATIRTMHARHIETGAAATLATSVIDDPTGYGRIVRDDDGGFVAIVEQKNLAPGQEAIREVYPSYACVRADALFRALAGVRRNPVSGEYYVTDVFPALRAEGGRVEVVDAVPPEDVLSINTVAQLAEVASILESRIDSPASEVTQP